MEIIVQSKSGDAAFQVCDCHAKAVEGCTFSNVNGHAVWSKIGKQLPHIIFEHAKSVVLPKGAHIRHKDLDRCNCRCDNLYSIEQGHFKLKRLNGDYLIWFKHRLLLNVGDNYDDAMNALRWFEYEYPNKKSFKDMWKWLKSKKWEVVHASS